MHVRKRYTSTPSCNQKPRFLLRDGALVYLAMLSCLPTENATNRVLTRSPTRGCPGWIPADEDCRTKTTNPRSRCTQHYVLLTRTPTGIMARLLSAHHGTNCPFAWAVAGRYNAPISNSYQLPLSRDKKQCWSQVMQTMHCQKGEEKNGYSVVSGSPNGVMANDVVERLM